MGVLCVEFINGCAVCCNERGCSVLWVNIIPLWDRNNDENRAQGNT